MGSFNVDLGDSGDSLADLPEQDGGTSISIQSLWDTHPVSSHVQQAVSAWRASMNVSLKCVLTAEFTCQIFKWPEQVRMHFQIVFPRTEALILEA